MSPADAPPRSAADAAREDYEAALRARAAAATADKRWADAALAWELLATIRPDDRQAAERLADSRMRLEATAADLQTRAEQAERRGDLDGAVQRWWAVLAVDPSSATAAAALRRIEGERDRKLYLGRHAGTAASRRTVAKLEAVPRAASAPR